MTAIAFNDGAGPDTQGVCDEMAARFERWMENNIEGHTLDEDLLESTPEGLVVKALGISMDGNASPQYETKDEHLKKWIQFLHSCGGFEVW